MAVAGPAWSFYDFQCGTPMLILALMFVAIVLVFARLRGALSLLGLGASLALVLLFVVPAILDGKSPVARGRGELAGGGADHDPARARRGGRRRWRQCWARRPACCSTVLLAWFFTNAAHLTGLASEEASLLQLAGANLSLQGLLLAGMVIGPLFLPRRRDGQPGLHGVGAASGQPDAPASAGCSAWPSTSAAIT